MRRSRIIYLVLFLAALGAGAFLARHLLAAETPLSGTWKVKVLLSRGPQVRELTFGIVKIEGKNKGDILAVFPQFEKGKVKDLKAEPKSLHFTLVADDQPFAIAAYVPAGETRPKKLLGSVRIGNQLAPAELEQTSDTEIKKGDAVQEVPDAKDLEKLTEAEGKKRQDELHAFLKKHTGSALGLVGVQMALAAEVQDKDASGKQIREVADNYSKLAAAFGPGMEQQAILNTTRTLILGKRKDLALEYARKAEKDLGKDASEEQRFAVLTIVQKALELNGKKEEAAKLTTELDEIFEKVAIPFKVKPYKGREGDSSRVVLVELFTGAQCPPCVAADVAFDAALKAYKPSEVAFLQYHLHIPGPDPLTNEATKARAEFYGDAVRGTPTTFVDGKTTPGLGGSRQGGEESYGTLSKLINEQLETAVGARVKLTVQRSGDKVDMEADVSGLKKPGKNVRLRFVLVEDVARFQGNNGQRLHHHVVRDFPGGVEGLALTGHGDSPKASVSLDKLREKLKAALDKMGADRFFNGERPLDFKSLKIVAFVQDDDSKKILQAAQADVPAAK